MFIKVYNLQLKNGKKCDIIYKIIAEIEVTARCADAPFEKEQNSDMNDQKEKKVNIENIENIENVENVENVENGTCNVFDEQKVLPIDIRDSARLLLRLFDKFDEMKAYNCASPKIEKMLAIISLAAMVHYSTSLFDVDIEKRTCGVGFQHLSGYFTGASGTLSLCVNQPLDISSCVIENFLANEDNNSIKYKFDNDNFIKNLPQFVRGLFVNAFIEFASYTPKAIGKLIDEFKSKILSDDGTIVELSKVLAYFSEQKNIDNAVIKFIVKNK